MARPTKRSLRDRLRERSLGVTSRAGVADHTHDLYPDGTTSRNHGHIHTWERGQQRTSRDNGHTHRIPANLQ